MGKKKSRQRKLDAHDSMVTNQNKKLLRKLKIEEIEAIKQQEMTKKLNIIIGTILIVPAVIVSVHAWGGFKQFLNDVPEGFHTFVWLTAFLIISVIGYIIPVLKYHFLLKEGNFKTKWARLFFITCMLISFIASFYVSHTVISFIMLGLILYFCVTGIDQEIVSRETKK